MKQYFAQFGLARRARAKKIIIGALASIIALFGIFAAVKFIKEQVTAITGNGSQVTITAGEYIYYGSWGTHVYTIDTSDGDNFKGFCVDPRKDRTSGSYTAKISSDSGDNKRIKLALYAYRGNKQAAKDLMNQIFTDNTFTGDKYAFIHALVGYIHSGDSTGLTAQQVNYLEDAKRILDTHIRGDTDVWVMAKDWRLYELSNPGSEQNIMWIEKNRQYGNIAVAKCDTINTNCVASGAANFGNVEFTLAYAGQERVYDENRGMFFSAGQVVATETTDASGTVTFTDLPLGLYVVGETGMNNPSLVYTRQEQEVQLDTGNTTKPVTFKNQIKRGDVKFMKVDEEGRSMAHIPFRITSNTTGEFHIVVSNNAGIVNTATSHIPHSENTNGYDSIADISNVSFQGYGTWFGLEGATGAMAPVNDSVGALPYDTYTIQELSCVNNQSCQNISSQSKTFTIDEDGIVFDLGNWKNNCSDYLLETVAVDNADGDKAITAASGARIKDTVSYRVKKEVSYTIVSKVMDKTTMQPVMYNGEIASSYVVIPQSNNGEGTAEMYFDFDATDLAGHTLVVFSYIFEDNVAEPVFSHDDWGNLDQSVIVPSISTVASNVEGDTKQIKAAPNQTIMDIVSYCLLPGRTYRFITGLVNMNQEPIQIGGAAVSTEKEITIPAGYRSCDSETIYLEFDATSLAGQDVMVAQAIVDVATNTQVGTTHFDPGDGSQVVTVVDDVEYSISTIATDMAGNKTIEAAPDQTIKDEITYCLIAGRQYRITTAVVGTDWLPIDGIERATETLYTPDTNCGKTETTITVDASSWAGRQIMVLQAIVDTVTDTQILETHGDPGDGSQIVTVAEPTEEITGTVATDNTDGDKMIEAAPSQTIKDTVEYCLIAGKEYSLLTDIIDSENGRSIGLDNGSNQIETQFTPSEACGSKTITISFDASSLAGKTLIVRQTLMSGNDTIEIHTDYSGPQTVIVASDEPPVLIMSTTAVDGSDGDKYIVADGNAVVKDTIEYCIKKNTEYHLSGTLMDKSTEQPVKYNGHNVSSDASLYQNSDGCGSKEMTFTFDATEYAGKELVVFEYLYEGTDNLVDSHASYSYTAQTVTVLDDEVPVSISTTATDDADGDKYIAATSNAKVRDSINYCIKKNTNYTISGKLMDKSTRQAVMYNGSEVTASTSVRQSTDGCDTTSVVFTFDATEYAGKELVVFEYLYEGSEVVDSHASYSSTSQTVTVLDDEAPVSISTTATDDADGDKLITATSNAKVKDTINYCIKKNTDYTISGTLMDKTTRQPVMYNGSEVTASTSVRQSTDGCDTTSVVFTFDATEYAGKDLVVFEYLYEGSDVVASHASYTSAAQTVTVLPDETPISIATIATDAIDGDKNIVASAGQKVKDTISYCLKTNSSYQIKGILMDKETGESIKVNGQTIEQTATITPTENCGRVELVFDIDASELAGKAVVAFEYTYSLDGGASTEPVVSHEDINDLSQTVFVVSLGTTATDNADGDKTIAPAANQKIKDTVDYCLRAGETFVIKGILKDKETGEDLQINGETIEQSIEVTTEQSCGQAELVYDLDASALAGKEIVVFEYAYEYGVKIPEDPEIPLYLVVSHEDIDDEAQTVNVSTPTPDTGFFSAIDGQSGPSGIVVIIAGITIAAGCYAGYRFRNKHHHVTFD